MLGALVALVALAACKGGGSANDPVDAPASPQASAEPAPLANVPETPSGAPTPPNPEAGPPPLPMRGDRELPVDVPREPTKDKEQARDTPKDPRDPKELAGWSLQAALRPSDVAPPLKAPEVNERGLDAARRKTEAHLAIDLSQGRMRIVLASAGFVLPQDSEVRARVDRYGHVLLLPREGTYRVVAPGALRALFGERRLDVAPLVAAEIAPGGEGPKRFNFRTRKVDVSTRAAKATFELATVKDSGEGGSLLCRALLDLMNATPSTPLCAPDEIPVRAELRWTTRGAVVFDVQSLVRRADLAAPSMAAPPASASFVSSPIPVEGSAVILSRAELAALRTGPIDLPLQPDAGAARVESGLVLVNGTDQLRVVWIDGVAVAWVAPGARVELPSLVRGRYVVQWRTFLGDAFEPGVVVSAPGASELGIGDAGARP